MPQICSYYPACGPTKDEGGTILIQQDNVRPHILPNFIEDFLEDVVQTDVDIRLM
jgi:hypothetical protein